MGFLTRSPGAVSLTMASSQSDTNITGISNTETQLTTITIAVPVGKSVMLWGTVRFAEVGAAAEALMLRIRQGINQTGTLITPPTDDYMHKIDASSNEAFTVAGVDADPGTSQVYELTARTFNAANVTAESYQLMASVVDDE